MRRLASTLLAAVALVGIHAPPAHSKCRTKACFERLHDYRARQWCKRHYRCIWRYRFNQIPAGWRGWAVSTGRCESGNNPRAYNAAGPYYGSHQFDWGTWREAQGHIPSGWRWYGNPATRSWHHQATVAVYLAQNVGTGRWPVCGH